MIKKINKQMKNWIYWSFYSFGAIRGSEMYAKFPSWPEPFASELECNSRILHLDNVHLCCKLVWVYSLWKLTCFATFKLQNQHMEDHTNCIFLFVLFLPSWIHREIFLVSMQRLISLYAKSDVVECKISALKQKFISVYKFAWVRDTSLADYQFILTSTFNLNDEKRVNKYFKIVINYQTSVLIDS